MELQPEQTKICGVRVLRKQVGASIIYSKAKLQEKRAGREDVEWKQMFQPPEIKDLFCGSFTAVKMGSFGNTRAQELKLTSSTSSVTRNGNPLSRFRRGLVLPLSCKFWCDFCSRLLSNACTWRRWWERCSTYVLHLVLRGEGRVGTGPGLLTAHAATRGWQQGCAQDVFCGWEMLSVVTACAAWWREGRLQSSRVTEWYSVVGMRLVEANEPNCSWFFFLFERCQLLLQWLTCADCPGV